MLLGLAWPIVTAGSEHKMAASDVRLALYCMAKLRVRDEKVLRRLADVAGDVAGDMSRFEVVNCLWALSSMRITRYDLKPLVSRFMSMLDKADGQNCSNFIYACHMLGWDNAEDYMAVVHRFSQL